ncbi:uncharacterized protein LOC141680621 [Apium graveolens]|uniref:uncharacterized protein LOC141680621 n=1 Tax=Apium graveolens TaxID=4045 RepID=UPI003D792098
MVNAQKGKAKEVTVTKQGEWIVDSGASDHLTCSLDNLVNVKVTPSTFTIKLPTGATTSISHIGDVILPNGLKLLDVLYVPLFTHNLLLIHKLAKDAQCDVLFQPSQCVVINSKIKKVIAKGVLKEGLYYMQCKTDPSEVCMSVAADTSSGEIRTIRTDNTLEFSDKACVEFMNQKGILHKKSCSYIPQQNARVERKHRHLLEVARALRFQSGLPLSFWGECVLTAAHLINLLPNITLNFCTPYEKLHEEVPTYEHLKVFRCLAFGKDPSCHNDKFTARGYLSIFVGYLILQKGFRLLNLV